jgi:regulator of protease activity HflC (stomatin/prohibitin superfamily)
MTVVKKQADKPLIHNPKPPRRRTDFSVEAAGLGILALIIAFVLAARLVLGSRPTAAAMGALLGAPAAAALAMSLFPRWSAAIKLLIVAAALAFAAWGIDGLAGADIPFALAFGGAAALLAPALQKTEEWERAIVLRLGRLSRVAGPGLFVLIPLADRVERTVDLRIRVTDFSAETTLTRDSVTITVDALCFWLVWDAEKAICEVEDYEEAVVLSAKTALRAAISKSDLTAFLERGDEIEDSIREEVDRKTTEWGITVQHIEITDVQIPQELQDSMSRLAQAEREKAGRVLLAEAEIEIARRLEEAARIYAGNEAAMRLKSLSILNEGLKAGNSMMLIPSSIADELRTKEDGDARR